MHISCRVQPDAYANDILSTFDEQGLLIRLTWLGGLCVTLDKGQTARLLVAVWAGRRP